MKRITIAATLEVPSAWTHDDVEAFVNRSLLSSHTERKTLDMSGFHSTPQPHWVRYRQKGSTMIINIRGTSGSGKSTVVRRMMEYAKTKTEIKNEAGKVIGYECTYSDISTIRFVGKYATACGGCDTIKTQDEVENLVRLWASEGYHVVFEGLLISTIFDRWNKLAADMSGVGFKFVFLTTNLYACLDRVRKRRADAAQQRARELKELNTTNTEAKFKTIQQVEQKFKAAGKDTVQVSSESAAETILLWL